MSTFRVAGGVPWHMPQLLPAYSVLPVAADAGTAGLLTAKVRLTVAAAAKLALPA